MSEEDVIFGHIDIFCDRVQCVIDQIVSLSQFQLLFKASTGLPRPKKEDLGIEDFDEEVETNIQEDDDDQDSENETYGEPNLLKLDDNEAFGTNKANLDILVEENEESSVLNSSLTPRKSILKKNGTSLGVKQNARKNGELASNHEDGGSEMDYEESDMNKKLIKSAELLFKTEQKTEADSKTILKKAQTLSRDDIKLMSKPITL